MTTPFSRILAFALFGGIAFTGLQAQTFTIADGTINSCTGALLDSGGQGASGYSNNENYTATICPDTPGEAISLQWLIFNLSTEGAAIDQIMIYDGQSTSDPLIGVWNGNDGSPGVVSASFANASGCLTVNFTSNATGTGLFSAAITCYQPCEPPTAVASVQGETIPVLGCQGETFTFDASASYGAGGLGISGYTWYFDDGTIDYTSGAIALHTFNEPGEYVVQVEVSDDNGCINTNVVDLQILISTTPLFTGLTTSQTLCQNATLNLDGTGTTAVEWSAVPTSNLGGAVALPDDQGIPFATSIDFNNFEPGQTVTSCTDITSICVNMEHSFMGDLLVTITCPNGQMQTLHQQGGGSTFLGDANDMDSGSNVVIGECWNYCWSSTATLGTWANESYTNNMPSSQGTALIPDTYSAVDPCTQLIGCPLNGTWTFTITDLWAIDNGFLCDWEINFDPSLYPSLTEFTPNLGLNDPDSAYWTGPGITDQGPATGITTNPEPGDHEYTFTVIDDFGCSYDTTITVTVIPAPEGPVNITGNDSICAGGVTSLSAPGGYESYVWNNGYTGQNVSVGEGTYTVTVGNGECTLTSDPFTVYAFPEPVPVIIGGNMSCGEPVTLTTEEPYDSYLWSNGSTESSITVSGGTYILQISLDGCPGTSAPYTVTPGSDPEAAFTTDPVSPQGIGTTVDFFDESTITGGQIVSWEWTFGNENNTSSQQSPSNTFITPGTYPIMLVITANDGCTDTLIQNFVILPEDIIIPNVFTPNNDGHNDLFVIENVEFFGNDLVVYNRWGQKVLEAHNYRNNWRASDVPDGTYFYTLRLENGNDYSGHVTIIR